MDSDFSKQANFQPPYCPNEDCRYHVMDNPQAAVRFYRHYGWAKTKRRPFRIKKFQCTRCKHVFRYTSFKLSYREQKPGLNARIFRLFNCGVSNREIGRQIHVSEHMIRIRFKKMFQWALLKHTILTENTLIEEAVAVDGLENFAGDQYEPNNINQAVGYGSLFIYDFGFAPMNRKGKMSDRQKAINKELEATQGRFDSQAIRTNFGEVVRRLIRKKSPKNEALTLHTDEHYQYKRAIRYDLRDIPIDHKTISSKAARNFQNILFSVNHSDLLIRQHVGAFKRETICFSKTHSRMIQKFALFMVWTNYFRPQYVRKHKLRPNAHRNTPAMHLGITKRCLKFFEFFDVKRTLKQVSLNPEWQMFYDETPTFTRTLREAVN